MHQGSPKPPHHNLPRSVRARRTARQLRNFLRPGLHLKRWSIPIILGISLAALGMSLIFGAILPPSLWDALDTVFFWLLGGGLLAVGIGVGLYGAWQTNRAMANLLLDPEHPVRSLELVETLSERGQRRQRRDGPKVVVIGGGTGMPTLLRGLRQYTTNITAVVTVADDGGSSGLLRQQMGVLPPGDFRNNIAALSDSEGLMTQVLQYRFGEKDGLGSHNFGNLFITTMAAIAGSFERGLEESSRVLAVRGRILPSTLEQVTLCAEVAVPFTPANGSPPSGEHPQAERTRYVRGESNIPEAGGRILRVHLEPEQCQAYPPTIRAILEADLIVAAPGSFFTSLMPNLLVSHIRQAIIASRAVRIYVCNVAGQAGETNGFTVSDHMRHLNDHAGEAFTTVLANSRYNLAHPPAAGVEWVTLPEPAEELPYRLFRADLAEEERPWRHDPDKVAAQLMALYDRLRTR